MARRIYGRIRSLADGDPLEGWRVEAYDNDDFAGDDYMGGDRTDADGRYSIQYRGGHWDPAPHEWTIWRPDIYVQVFAPIDAPGGWIKMWQSAIHGNWRLRNDLRVDAAVWLPSANARTVSGTITWSNETWPAVGSPGQPAAGVRVTAYDEDGSFSAHMGSAVADEQGRYRIPYAGGKWDVGSGGSWRPDIRVEAAVEYDGKWHNVHTSTTFGDVRHQRGLVYDAEAHFAEPGPTEPPSQPSGTIWTIMNCNPSLWVRVRFENSLNWQSVMPGEQFTRAVMRNETLNFTSQTRVGRAWLYTSRHSLEGGDGVGIEYDSYCIGGGRFEPLVVFGAAVPSEVT